MFERCARIVSEREPVVEPEPELGVELELELGEVEHSAAAVAVGVEAAHKDCSAARTVVPLMTDHTPGPTELHPGSGKDTLQARPVHTGHTHRAPVSPSWLVEDLVRIAVAVVVGSLTVRGYRCCNRSNPAVRRA